LLIKMMKKQINDAMNDQENGVLSDTELKKMIHQYETTNDTTDDDKNNANNNLRKVSFVGTAQYVTPELLANKSYSFAGMDFWAIGCIIFECLTGKPPFHDNSDYLTFQKIEKMEYEIPDYISSNAKDIIQKFLDNNHQQRLGMNGFDQIKKHPFFENISFEWDQLASVPIPPLPSTPINSPIHEDDRKHRSSSNYDNVNDLQPMALNDNDKDKDNNKNNLNNEIIDENEEIKENKGKKKR